MIWSQKTGTWMFRSCRHNIRTHSINKWSTITSAASSNWTSTNSSTLCHRFSSIIKANSVIISNSNQSQRKSPASFAPPQSTRATETTDSRLKSTAARLFGYYSTKCSFEYQDLMPQTPARIPISIGEVEMVFTIFFYLMKVSEILSMVINWHLCFV